MRLTRRWVFSGASGGALGLLAAACGGATQTAPAGPTSPPAPTAAATPEPRELVVLAAASLTDAFTEMGEDFPKQPGMAGVKLTYSFGASSQLRQIGAGLRLRFARR